LSYLIFWFHATLRAGATRRPVLDASARDDHVPSSHEFR